VVRSFWTHLRKEQDVANGVVVRKQHHKTVYSNAESGSWRKSNLDGMQEVFVYYHCFIVSGCTDRGLLF
jgi:hypothetical protein